MIMKLIITAIAACILAGCTAFGPAAQSVSPTAAISPTPQLAEHRLIDFHINNVRLGDTEEQIRKQFGKPRSQKVEKVDYCGLSEIKKLKYPGFEVWLDRGSKGDHAWGILEITVESTNVLIEPNIRIGDSLAEITANLGPPIGQIAGDEPSLGYLTRDNDNASLEFKNGKLTQVRLFINPC